MTRAGLVGAGPWADLVHAPGLAAHGGVRFTHVWARNPAAAGLIADRYGLTACATHGELLDSVDLVSYSVPPDVQAPLATAARASGKLVLLEKPAARSAAAAARLAGASALPAVVNYSRLLDAGVQRWISDHRDRALASARIVITNGAVLSGSPFGRSPWRHERDASLWDLGPHAVSLLVAVLGRVAEAAADWSGESVRLRVRHDSGSRSEVLCSLAAGDEESYEFAAADGTLLRLPGGFSPQDAFRRALDGVLYGAGGPGDRAALDLGFTTHVVDVLECSAKSLADGAPRSVGGLAGQSRR